MMVTNVVDRKETEDGEEMFQALGRKVKEYSILHEVAQIATESLDVDRVLHTSLDKVIESMAVEAAAILLVTGKDGQVIAAARGGISSAFLDGVKGLPTDHTITNRLALSGVPIVIEDVSKYPQLVDMPARLEGFNSIAALPLKSSGRVIGTLIIASHNLHAFSSADIQLFSVISEGLGPVLKNAELYSVLRAKSRQPATRNRGKTNKRSLYDCFNARVKGHKIYCAKGNPLHYASPDLHIVRLERGAPLVCSVCQECPGFDRMGPPLPKEERGYSHL